MNQGADFTFPLALVLIPFGIFLLIFIFYAALNVYHLLRFGIAGFHLWFIVSVFTLGSAALLIGSMLFLSTFDWSGSLSILNVFDLPASLPGV